MAAYKIRDYQTALKLLQPLAEQGNAEAQYALGMYYRSQQIAANQNEVENSGPAIEALKWYRKAAEQGYAPAQNMVGVFYREGSGVKKDYVESVTWYLKGAKQGDAAAQQELSWMYLKGLGVPQDNGEAYFWRSIGAKSVPFMAVTRDQLLPLLSPEQKTALDARVEQWKPVLELPQSALPPAPYNPPITVVVQPGAPVPVASGATAHAINAPALQPTDPCAEYKVVNPAFYANCEKRMKPKPATPPPRHPSD